MRPTADLLCSETAVIELQEKQPLLVSGNRVVSHMHASSTLCNNHKWKNRQPPAATNMPWHEQDISQRQHTQQDTAKQCMHSSR